MKFGRKRTKLNNKGVTLVELIISVAILTVVVAPLLHTFTVSVRYNHQAKEKQRAMDAAQSIMENFKANDLVVVQETFDDKSFLKSNIGNSEIVYSKPAEGSVTGEYRIQNFTFADTESGETAQYDAKVTVTAEMSDESLTAESLANITLMNAAVDGVYEGKSGLAGDEYGETATGDEAIAWEHVKQHVDDLLQAIYEGIMNQGVEGINNTNSTGIYLTGIDVEKWNKTSDVHLKGEGENGRPTVAVNYTIDYTVYFEIPYEEGATVKVYQDSLTIKGSEFWIPRQVYTGKGVLMFDETASPNPLKWNDRYGYIVDHSRQNSSWNWMSYDNLDHEVYMNRADDEAISAANPLQNFYYFYYPFYNGRNYKMSIDIYPPYDVDRPDKHIQYSTTINVKGGYENLFFYETNWISGGIFLYKQKDESIAKIDLNNCEIHYNPNIMLQDDAGADNTMINVYSNLAENVSGISSSTYNTDLTNLHEVNEITRPTQMQYRVNIELFKAGELESGGKVIISLDGTVLEGMTY